MSIFLSQFNLRAVLFIVFIVQTVHTLLGYVDKIFNTRDLTVHRRVLRIYKTLESFSGEKIKLTAGYVVSLPPAIIYISAQR